MKKENVKKMLDILDEENKEAITEWIYARAIKGMRDEEAGA